MLIKDEDYVPRHQTKEQKKGEIYNNIIINYAWDILFLERKLQLGLRDLGVDLDIGHINKFLDSHH